MRPAGVPAAVVARHRRGEPEDGPAMAQGVRAAFHATVAPPVTVIAGPSGGSPEKPVGTVYIALAADQEEEVCHYQFYGNREEIKILTAETALDLLRRELKE